LDFPVARINLAALRHNLNRVKQLAPHSRVMSVIKADAYGHGVFSVAAALKDSDAFAVARLSEGVSLREQGIDKPIVLLEGVNSEAEFILAAKHQLSPVIHLHSQIALLQSITLPKPLSFNWLMIDSGMHRLGIRPEQALSALSELQQSKNIDGEIGLMSHFANSDLVGDSRNQAQLDAMLSLKQSSGLALCLANSAAVMSLPESHQDWVRPGLMLYGISPFADNNADAFDLQPAMQLSSRLIAVYEINAGEEVGYGGDWVAEQRTRVGVVSIGYGDGYSRHLSNQGEVLIHGQRVPLIGRVSMDTICLNLNEVELARVGDEVILWGDQNLPVEFLAERAQTIPYELVTVICPRVKRVESDG
jgi:alanine racemase